MDVISWVSDMPPKGDVAQISRRGCTTERNARHVSATATAVMRAGRGD